MNVCVPCVAYVHGSLNRASDPLELVVNRQVSPESCGRAPAEPSCQPHGSNKQTIKIRREVGLWPLGQGRTTGWALLAEEGMLFSSLFSPPLCSQLQLDGQESVSPKTAQTQLTDQKVQASRESQRRGTRSETSGEVMLTMGFCGPNDLSSSTSGFLIFLISCLFPVDSRTFQRLNEAGQLNRPHRLILLAVRRVLGKLRVLESTL